MTIAQLKARLKKIPPTGPVNIARRLEIIALINKKIGG